MMIMVKKFVFLSLFQKKVKESTLKALINVQFESVVG